MEQESGVSSWLSRALSVSQRRKAPYVSRFAQGARCLFLAMFMTRFVSLGTSELSVLGALGC